MTDQVEAVTIDGAERPAGFLQPEESALRRILRALDENRTADAESEISSLDSTSLCLPAWASLVQGRLALGRTRLMQASQHFMQSASLALNDEQSVPQASCLPPSVPQASCLPLPCAPLAPNDEQREHAPTPVESAERVRLGGLALRYLGIVKRRQDLVEDAIRAHDASWHLYREHGSFEELGQAACELGMDHSLTHRSAEAERWFLTAIALGGQSRKQPHDLLARNWSGLARLFLDCGRYADAVEAARNARTESHTHDLASAWAARSDAELGHTLLLSARAAAEEGARNVVVAPLDEALEWLTAAREALLAFGPEETAGAAWCAEQIEFARRLRESLAE